MLDASTLIVRFAESEEDILAAGRLRYRVFVEELGGDGPMVDHVRKFERDRFDPFSKHLVLIDPETPPSTLDHVVGVYRVMTEAAADAAGQFYSEDEYDLSLLRASGRKLLELGRSCVAREFRGGTAVWRLWSALAQFVEDEKIEILFGVASFHGTDLDALAEPLSLLDARHLAPEDIRVRAKSEVFQPMNLVADADIQSVRAMKAVPALIKSYLRLGGFVGEGAFVDHAFNTTDVCLILDTDRMSPRQRKLLVGTRQ